MSRLAAGSCSREIRPLLLAFQLHFTALHICCGSYFSASRPPRQIQPDSDFTGFLTAQPSFPFFIHNKFRLSLSFYSPCPLFVIYLFGLFNSVGAQTGQVMRSRTNVWEKEGRVKEKVMYDTTVRNSQVQKKALEPHLGIQQGEKQTDWIIITLGIEK